MEYYWNSYFLKFTICLIYVRQYLLMDVESEESLNYFNHYHYFSQLWCWKRLFDLITLFIFSVIWKWVFLFVWFSCLFLNSLLVFESVEKSSFLNFSAVSTICQLSYWFLFGINTPCFSLLRHWTLQSAVYVSFWLQLGQNKAFTKAELWAYNDGKN